MSDCAKCHRERTVRDQSLAERVDTWTTARELLRSITAEGEQPAPDDVLALYITLSGGVLISGGAE
jgi:hypothetical protein